MEFLDDVLEVLQLEVLRLGFEVGVEIQKSVIGLQLGDLCRLLRVQFLNPQSGNQLLQMHLREVLHCAVSGVEVDQDVLEVNLDGGQGVALQNVLEQNLDHFQVLIIVVVPVDDYQPLDDLFGYQNVHLFVPLPKAQSAAEKRTDHVGLHGGNLLVNYGENLEDFEGLFTDQKRKDVDALNSRFVVV